MNIGSSFGGWILSPTVYYNDNSYSVNRFDLNSKDGHSGMNLQYAAISSDGETFTKNDTGNKIINAGKTITIRTLGVVKMEPDKKSDGFDFEVNLPNSSGEMEYFTYRIG